MDRLQVCVGAPEAHRGPRPLLLLAQRGDRAVELRALLRPDPVWRSTVPVAGRRQPPPPHPLAPDLGRKNRLGRRPRGVGGPRGGANLRGGLAGHGLPLQHAPRLPRDAHPNRRIHLLVHSERAEARVQGAEGPDGGALDGGLRGPRDHCPYQVGTLRSGGAVLVRLPAAGHPGRHPGRQPRHERLPRRRRRRRELLGGREQLLGRLLGLGRRWRLWGAFGHAVGPQPLPRRLR
mmetsp:Transcript_46621/g.105362  ORF Transcript_46621/g.105362 Transcript_46621/m.105362 type:complete len:234 (-) Transcript_46621:626-1327(-)